MQPLSPVQAYVINIGVAEPGIALAAIIIGDKNVDDIFYESLISLSDGNRQRTGKI